MLKLDAGLQLEPGASPNVLFKFIGQTVQISGALEGELFSIHISTMIKVITN